METAHAIFRLTDPEHPRAFHTEEAIREKVQEKFFPEGQQEWLEPMFTITLAKGTEAGEFIKTTNNKYRLEADFKKKMMAEQAKKKKQTGFQEGHEEETEEEGSSDKEGEGRWWLLLCHYRSLDDHDDSSFVIIDDHGDFSAYYKEENGD